MPLPANPPATPATLSQNARTVLEKRYLVKDKSGKPVETPEDMFWRVATTIAEADRKYGATDKQIEKTANQFYELMTQRRFEPNSPTLMNAGRPLGQLTLGVAQDGDERLGRFQTLGDHGFGRRLGTAGDQFDDLVGGLGLNHHDRDVIADNPAGDDHVEDRALKFRVTREGHPLAVDEGDAHAADRAGEG